MDSQQEKHDCWGVLNDRVELFQNEICVITVNRCKIVSSEISLLLING